ncbi:MAG TPA: hypothetical protein VK426_09865, partial [Methanobacterium sp.]|nr:hypothetical protein [Methanobacterium sp.]
ELIIYRNKSVLKNFGAFLSPTFAIVALGLLALLIIKPHLLSQLIQQGTSTYLVYLSSSTVAKPITIFKYIAFVGILVTLFSFIGSIVVLRTKQKLGIFLLLWAFAIFLISESFWFGFSVDTVRFLVYILIPLSILGGFGLDYVYDIEHPSKKLSTWRFKSLFLTGTSRVSQSLGLLVTKIYQRFSTPRFRSTLLISVFILSLFLGLLATEKPFTFYAESSFGNVQIAPPSDSEADLANWFQINGDKQKIIIISNRYTGIFISAETGMQINPNFGYLNKNSPKSVFDNHNIGYIVIDKRLSLSSGNGTLQMKDGGSGLYYFSGDIHQNINQILPDYAHIVYENNDFIVAKL